MRHVITATLIVLTLAVVALGPGIEPASAQSVLKRLEEKIRHRVEQARGAGESASDDQSGYTGTADRPTGPAPPPPTAEQLPPPSRPSQPESELVPRPEPRKAGQAIRGLFGQLLGGDSGATDRATPERSDATNPPALISPDQPGEAPALAEPFPRPLEPAPAAESEELARLRQRVEQLETRVKALEQALRAREAEEAAAD